MNVRYANLGYVQHHALDIITKKRDLAKAFA